MFTNDAHVEDTQQVNEEGLRYMWQQYTILAMLAYLLDFLLDILNAP